MTWRAKSKKWKELSRLLIMLIKIEKAPHPSWLSWSNKLKRRNSNSINKSNLWTKKLKKKNRWRTIWKPRRQSKMSWKSYTDRLKLTRRSTSKDKVKKHSGAFQRIKLLAWFLKLNLRSTKKHSIEFWKPLVPRISMNSSATSLKLKKEISRLANTSMSWLKKMNL